MILPHCGTHPPKIWKTHPLFTCKFKSNQEQSLDSNDSFASFMIFYWSDVRAWFIGSQSQSANFRADRRTQLLGAFLRGVFLRLYNWSVSFRFRFQTCVSQLSIWFSIQVFNHKEILYIQFRPVYHPSHSETLIFYHTHFITKHESD